MPCSTRSQKPTIGNFTRTILEHYFVTDVLADQFRLNLTSIRLAKSTYYRHYRILYTNNFFTYIRTKHFSQIGQEKITNQNKLPGVAYIQFYHLRHLAEKMDQTRL